MSLIIRGMKLPQHSAINGGKDTVYRCIVLAHPDNTIELVIDTEFASAYDNGHNIQRYPLAEIPSPHGRLIDADNLNRCIKAMLGDSDVIAVFERIIQRQPTIIEAEGADNE